MSFALISPAGLACAAVRAEAAADQVSERESALPAPIPLYAAGKGLVPAFRLVSLQPHHGLLTLYPLDYYAIRSVINLERSGLAATGFLMKRLMREVPNYRYGL